MTEHMYRAAKSKQDYETPADLLAAIAERFGPIEVDLACRLDNKKAPIGLHWPEIDSFSVSWGDRFPDAISFLNPEWNDIPAWAAKCAEEALKLRHGRIVMLTPSAVGSNWYASHCYRKSLTISLNGRITFVGAKLPFPKDCMLSVYAHPLAEVSGFEVWRWKGGEPKIRKRRVSAPKASASSRTITVEEHLEHGEAK